MDNVEREMVTEVLDRLYAGLIKCRQPFGCSEDCPYFKDAKVLEHPIAFCSAVMAGEVGYVRTVLQRGEKA